MGLVSKESQGSAVSARETVQVRVTHKAKVQLECDGTEREVNQYRIIEKIGSGAFSEVYKCVNKYDLSIITLTNGPQTIFAMKVMSRSFLRRKKEFIRTAKGRPTCKTALDDVEREIAIMKKISHKNIVRFYELIDDTAGDSIYLIMEYLPRGQVMYWNNKLKAYKDSGGNVLSEIRSLEVLKDVTLGLNYLHSNNIIHRDLKPENILIGVNNEAKIADFGVAHKIGKESNSDSISKCAGTPWFMSPEAVSDPEYNSYGVDLWAIGVCLFVFVFGQLPFFADEAAIDKLYDKILKSPLKLPFDLTKTGSSTGGLVTELLKRLLEKDHTKRMSLLELIEKLQLKIEEEFNAVIVTDDEINTAISVRIDFATVVKLKLFVTRWRRKARLTKQLSMSKDVFTDVVQGYIHLNTNDKFASQSTLSSGEIVSRRVNTDNILTTIKEGEANEKQQPSSAQSKDYNASTSISSSNTSSPVSPSSNTKRMKVKQPNQSCCSLF